MENNSNLLRFVDLQLNCPDYLIYICEFLLETGIRPSELLRISGRDLNYESGKLCYIQKKNMKSRELVLSPVLLSKARYFRKFTGNFIKNLNNMKYFRKIIFEFITPKFTLFYHHNRLYYFRYCYTLQKLELGYSKEEISNMLGHSDRASVNFYLNAAEQIKKNELCKGGNYGKA